MSTNSKPNKYGFIAEEFESKEPEITQETVSQSSTVATPTEPIPVKEAPQKTSQLKEETKSKTSTPNKKKKKETSLPIAPIKSTVSEESGTVGKRSDPNYKVVGTLLPLKAHKKAKILLMDDPEGRDFSDLMTDLLEAWLAEQSL